MPLQRPTPALVFAGILATCSIFPILAAIRDGPSAALATHSGLTSGGGGLREHRPDLNRSPIGHLQLVPGLGPVRAGALLVERTRGGAFRDYDEIARRVRGIGPTTVERLRGWTDLRFTAPDELPAASRLPSGVRLAVRRDQGERLD